MTKWIATIAIVLFSLTSTAQAQKVKVSWYDCAKPGQCSKSKKTASGKKFNPNGLTAAHRSLPFGTKIRLTHKGRSVIVVVNDRGPFVRGRQLDISRGAARSLGCHGVCVMDMRVLG